ncbi:MAG TPA: hypothetical protein VN788_06495 [Verrucomicrobiae bacterium]|nr:hypothetical protein [Bryobacteraceae bacterium]HXU20212.1 hypothetical protein [Verrucomicrobiae bacterium]
MTPGGSDSNGPPGAHREQPIRELMEQGREPSPDFMQRIQRKIYRRAAGSQLASYSWHLPKIILVEMASLLSHLFKTFGTDKESEP